MKRRRQMAIKRREIGSRHRFKSGVMIGINYLSLIILVGIAFIALAVWPLN